MKLLFVDPNKIFQEIVRALFAQTDVQVCFANGYAEAVELTSKDWYFVCASLHLPDGGGLKLCRHLRQFEEYKHTPIILFTSTATDEVHTWAAKSGATDVFLKSNVQDLVNFVSRYSSRIRKISGRILYVEDSNVQALVIRNLLASHGLDVEWYSSGEEAWAAFQQRAFDLVLSDLVLSGSMSGAALISQIRSMIDERGDMPIIAITAFDNLSRRIDLFHLGVNDYVIKPVVEEELISRVRNHVAEANAKASLRASYEQLRAAKDELVRSEKLASLGALVAGVAHELNTPIGNGLVAGTALRDRLVVFRDDLARDGLRRQAFENFLSSIDAALDIVLSSFQRSADLVRSFKRSSTDRTASLRNRFSLGALLRDFSVSVKPLFEGRSVTLTIEMEEDIFLDSYADILLQALLDLAENSVVHGFDGRDGGEIRLRVAPGPKGVVDIGFSDNGRGIAPENLPKIFDPFFTTKLGQGGSGLGLHGVHNLVTQVLGGTVKVSSECGVGTEFVLRLPLISALA